MSLCDIDNDCEEVCDEDVEDIGPQYSDNNDVGIDEGDDDNEDENEDDEDENQDDDDDDGDDDQDQYEDDDDDDIYGNNADADGKG